MNQSVPSDRPWFKYWPSKLPKTLDYPEVPLFNIIEVSSQRYPNKIAVIYYGNRITYRELWESIIRFSSFLSNELKVKKGDRIAIFMPNSVQWIIAYFGILRANAILVPINPLLAEDEINYILRDSGSVGVVTLSSYLSKVIKAKENSQVKWVIAGRFKDYLPEQPEIRVHPLMQREPELSGDAIYWKETLRNNYNPPPVEVNAEDIAVIPYTSGTTGVPKGCVHTHSTIWPTVLGSVVWNMLTPSAVVLSSLPIFHVTGFVHSVNAPLYTGSTMVLLSIWDREAALDAIEKYKVTHWTNISTMVVDLLATPGIEKRDLSSLILVGGGGAPMPEAVAKRLKELTGLDYVEGYGLTETMSQTHVNPPQRPKLQCLGIPHFGVDALIIDPSTGEVLPPNREGEIVVRCPSLFKGYWNKEEETRKSFITVNGLEYFRTGDLGYMDEEGYFFIMDRIKRMINRAGYKVWPTKVENKLYQHPAVLEACVVATPDPRTNEEVKAYIVLKSEYKGKITAEEIREWCKQHMSAYEYPRVIEFVDSLPKSGSGKILWRVLQEKEKGITNK
ncbi:long-chain fatty acid--CoA ligase [Saccharolobus shibatae]|uniref:Long-chain-fatty-acid--CoA ligase n=1 Tax=Saccharolobus shibatae TaxID=2286 RepID=A0A8F5C0H1_9CREN|nr:long-chain fatty acid--CoA ligase [Saccharolobus shibatae]QXJ34788.1 Long-chain-fatty-acid--CoA ligase [Saccharolobus shibatae]